MFQTVIPQNYLDIPVGEEIPNKRHSDADGAYDLIYRNFWFPYGSLCTITQIGDNHLGYVGFREPTESLGDNGAMNMVVETVRTTP
jgi:hypothetical protein